MVGGFGEVAQADEHGRWNGVALPQRSRCAARQRDDAYLNSRYLLDVTQQIEGDTARFLMSDAASPTVVREVGDSSATYVLMPMRV